MAALEKAGQDTLRIVPPATFGIRPQRRGEVDDDRLSCRITTQPHLVRVVRRCRDHRAPLDRHGQNEAIIEVGELTDQVDSSGRAREPTRRSPEVRIESITSVGGDVRDHWRLPRAMSIPRPNTSSTTPQPRLTLRPSERAYCALSPSRPYPVNNAP